RIDAFGNNAFKSMLLCSSKEFSRLRRRISRLEHSEEPQTMGVRFHPARPLLHRSSFRPKERIRLPRSVETWRSGLTLFETIESLSLGSSSPGHDIRPA